MPVVKSVEVIVDKARASYPDIDIDIGENPLTGKNKDTIISYLQQKYGHDHVAQIGNRVFYTQKTAIQDIATAFDIPADETRDVTKIYNDSLSVEENMKNSPVIQDYFNKYPEMKDLVPKFDGVSRNMSVHAGGVVISSENYPLSRYCALQRPVNDSINATMWTKEEVEAIGLIKYDILGLNAASQVHLVRTLAGLDPYKDEPDEPEVYKQITTKLLHRNIFQFESSLGIKAFYDLTPDNINELSNASGIIRVMGSEEGRRVYNEYADNVKAYKSGRKNYWIDSLKQSIEDEKNLDVCVDVLRNTYGILIYQEQLASLINKLSGGKKTFYDGNKVRKMLGKLPGKYGSLERIQSDDAIRRKWHAEIMSVFDEYLLPYIGKDGYESSQRSVVDFIEYNLDSEGKLPIPACGILNWFIVSSTYIFSRLHSTAYSVISYAQMYQKYHYPALFWFAAMTTGSATSIKDYISYIRTESPEINLLPPDINKSDYGFTLENDTSIRFGLGHIQSFDKMARKIIENRNENGKFQSIEDLITRVKPNKTHVENLLYSNSLLEFGKVSELIPVISKIKEINILTDRNAINEKEFKILGTNISFNAAALLGNHSDAIPVMNVPKKKEYSDRTNYMVAVKINKKEAKKSKKSEKNYFRFTIECLNRGSYHTFACFDTELGAKIKEGENMFMFVQRTDTDFFFIGDIKK